MYRPIRLAGIECFDKERRLSDGWAKKRIAKRFIRKRTRRFLKLVND